MSREILKKAFDTTNGWIYDTSSYAKAVAPAKFDEMVMDFASANAVIAPQGRQIDFRKAGRSWTVTVDAAPGAVAAVVAETDAVTYTAITNRQITFTPTTKAAAYQASYEEMQDGFLNFMENASKKIGYQLGLKKDQLAYSTLVAGATGTSYANSKTLATDLNATDLFSPSLILEGRKVIGKAYYSPADVFIGRDQEADLLDTSNITRANEFGTRSAIANGLLGTLYGIRIFVSDSIVASSNVAKAVLVGKTGSGEQAFGIAVSQNPMLESDKDIEYRQIKVVGTERYDIKVIHPSAVRVLGSYVA